MIRVLIVENSPVAREFLTYVLTSDPSILVVGTAKDGLEAQKAVRQEKPDVITMDIHMPIMDGFEATRRIMETVPTPIVIVSGSLVENEVASTFRAIEAGALAVVRRPPGFNHEEFEAASKEFIRIVKLMSEVKVVRRIPQKDQARTAARPPLANPPQKTAGIQAVAMGASVGGPPVLKTILSGLPPSFPVPVLIVQHMARGFMKGFTEWISNACGFPVRIAAHGERPKPRHGYVAPDGFHLGLESGPRIALSSLAPENGFRPSISHLFRSVAQALGPAAVGVLLTGMGRDGVEELKILNEMGALTMAQDEGSSVVHGMPGEAIKLGAATYVLPPEGMAALLADVMIYAH